MSLLSAPSCVALTLGCLDGFHRAWSHPPPRDGDEWHLFLRQTAVDTLSLGAVLLGCEALCANGMIALAWVPVVPALLVLIAAIALTILHYRSHRTRRRRRHPQHCSPSTPRPPPL